GRESHNESHNDSITFTPTNEINISHICCNLATVEKFVNSIEVGRFRKQFKALLVKKYYERKTVISPYPKTSSLDNFLGIPLSETAWLHIRPPAYKDQFNHASRTLSELSWLQMEESTLENILEEKMLSFGSQNK
ncbi:hypothetical protein KUTeg_015049, partial [Tegillarca granosa]